MVPELYEAHLLFEPQRPQFFTNGIWLQAFDDRFRKHNTLIVSRIKINLMWVKPQHRILLLIN